MAIWVFAGALLVLVSALAGAQSVPVGASLEGEGECLLTAGEPHQPDPTLLHCFTFNSADGACCASAHDYVIQKEYKALFSPPCEGLFGDLERFMCAACAPEMGSFVTNDSVTICQDFANRLWRGAGSSQYDKCGFLVGDGEDVLLPGLAGISSAEQFLNYQLADGKYPFRPPFLKDRTVRVVPTQTNCFTSGAFKPQLAGATAVAALLAVAHSLLKR